MGLHPMSFLIGLGAAWALPLVTRILRPFAVEATVASMAAFEEGRRILAEQLEVMEDIAAEAKSRRERALAEVNEGTADDGAASAESARLRRRAPETTRRRAS
jgi:hypothetical protein